MARTKQTTRAGLPDRSGRATEQLPNKLTETWHRLPLSQAETGSHRTTSVYEDSAKSSTKPNYRVHQALPRPA